MSCIAAMTEGVGTGAEELEFDKPHAEATASWSMVTTRKVCVQSGRKIGWSRPATASGSFTVAEEVSIVGC